ncbi:uncharacterized protein [Palaemon carinicauda]|uniref:uncharacterized protein n=1 Tax=Palaemon carinicauda TaxID=392227 RepID=UPI0035B570C8
MLKWTLRNASDAPTPPLPDVRYQVRRAEVKLNLKDSNKCWLETQVKVAQVRSTSKIAGTAKENEVLFNRENGKFCQEKENESLFRRLLSPSHSHVEDDKKRKRHHKHYRNSSCRCNPLDPLRLFSGEVTDSDTGSVYMRLEHTPVALQPRPQVIATTGLNDPRRKPLCDISNGDYSDLRKHLQCISSSSHLHYHHHHHPNSQELPQYLQRFAASSQGHCHSSRNFGGHFQQRSYPPPPRPDPLGASDSQSNLNLDPRRRSRSSSRSRSRSSSAPRSLPLTAVNSSLLEGSTITTTSSHSISARGVAEGKSQSMIHEGQCPEVHSYCLKRHSIADIPTEASFRGVWQIQKERRGRSSSHERKKENTYERVKSPKHCKDRRKEKEEGKEEGRGKTPRERVEGRRASRVKVKGEPIYERVDNGDTSESPKTNSGSSLNSKNSYNSFDNAVYMSMKDLRERCTHDKSDGCTCQQEHLYSSLHMRISPDPNKTPVHMHDHLYENMLYLPMTEVKSVVKKPMDLNRPLPDPPNFDDNELDSTCDFTSEPQKDIHKPVAIKISNDLIARFGKSPNDRQHPMPQYGLYIAAQPSKKPCKIEDCHQSSGHRSQSDKPGKVYKSTGQHVHINYSHGKHDDPSIPLHNLRPPPPPPPRKSRSSQGSTKTKAKSKGSTKPKLDVHLPVIYENTRQEEELVHSAKKRKLRHRMEIEFSFDDEDRQLNRSSEEASVSGSSPRGHNTSSSDNPDSGVSEGVNSPLVSPLSAPRSPQTPRSDSLLEEPCTPLTMDELHDCNKSPREDTNSNRNSNIYANLSHDMTDPRFLSLLRDSGQLNHSITEAYIDDLFHQVNQQAMQHTLSSISQSNFETTYRSLDQLESPIPNKSVDLSKMLLSAVGRNLFSDSTKVSTPGREAKTHASDAPHNSSSLSRRHSFSSLADISRRLSKIEFNDDTTSLWGMDVSDHDTSPSLKKTKSLQCLDLSFKSPITGSVPLRDSMAEILKDPEEISFLFPASKSQELSHDKMSTCPEESVQSGQWWLPGGGASGSGYWNDGSEEEKGPPGGMEGRTGEVSPTEGSGKRAGAGGQAAQPGSFSELPSSHDRHPISSRPSITPTSHRSPSSNPTLPLPVMSRGQQHLGMGCESASASSSSSSSSCYSVPLGPPSCEEENSFLLDLSQCVSGCGGDSTILTLDNASQLTARQQRRREESSYRLQRMLQDRSRSPQEHEQDESVSADWSMEAVLDEASTFEHHDLDIENNDSSESPPESQDAISLYTLGSEFADSIYISPKLCEKIKEVSEEKMLARLRKSFRSKKEKASTNGQITNDNNSAKPKVGILMFVDNPMYLSPEVKKEAKVVSSQQQNSVWYVGNPMYNSPDPSKLRNLNYDTKQRVICEKENQRNARLAKVICQNNNLRKPLGSLWLQSNPCYYSPDVKNPSSSNPNNKNSSSVNNNNNNNIANQVQRTFVREKPDDHYLTPISVKPTKDVVPRPSVVPLDELCDGDILDLQKFIDHEYCTIPGDESDSWVSQSTSRKSDSPVARRTLEFGSTKKPKDDRNPRKSVTPSRIWRQTGKNQHSTPRKYQGTLEKSLDAGATLGTRVHRTPRAVKRGKKSKETKDYRSNSPTPPPLPARPHPGHPHYANERTKFEDTSDFHRLATDDMDDSTKFQLPPDSVYESITFLQGKSEKKLPAEWVAQSRILDRAPPTGLSCGVRSSVCSSSSSSFRNCSRKGGDSVRRSASCVSSFTSGAKNGLGPGSLSEGSLKARSARKCTSTRKVTKKYRARDVLQGKGQLKIAVYENYGLLTIHIIEAKKLRSRLSSVCNPYVKISLVPDTEERTFCRTPLVRATNAPQFDQKFSFDFLPEDLDKRLLVSVWSRDTLRKRSEFLGCMSFSISHISTKRVHGWFRLLTETLGRRKHFAVSFLNASHDTTRNKMEEVLILDDRTSTTSNHEREPLYSTLEHHQGQRRERLAKSTSKDDLEELVLDLDEDDGPGLAFIRRCSALPNQNVNANEAVRNSPRKPTGQTPYTITICISKGNQGYGFSVKWTKPPRVERVEPGLAADRAGLQPGDYVIFIGEHNVVKYDENTVLQIIRECGETLIMEVYRRGVTKVPRGLANGFASRASVSESTASNEAHPRKRLSHITFNSEAGVEDRQNIIYSLINCEQAFSNACRFGLERYFIPLKFRTDLITQAQHAQLFSNMDQLVDISDSVIDSLMGNDDDEGIGDNVGFTYYQMVDEMAENYSKYFRGLPEADKLLSHKLHEIDFKDFLLTPKIPRKKPDITTFIHKPAEHIRELVGLLTKLYSSSPGQKDNTYLDTVLDRLKACYRGMTSQQNIMEPSPQMSPTGIAGNALRPPLVSVSDIEQRLVFTKYTQPFRLHDNRRQWVFGGELHKFEGRNLKQYWVMLFTDLLLFTKINRDRVIFVMEDPVPLTAVLHAVFTVKKKATEFRLIIDSTVKVPGATNSYMTLPKTQRATKKKKNHNTVTLGRENKRTLVLRAPSLELKATWSNLIQRQLTDNSLLRRLICILKPVTQNHVQLVIQNQINPREGQQLSVIQNQINPREGRQLSVIHNQINPREDKPKRGPVTLSHTEPDKPKRGSATPSHTEPDKPKRGSATLSRTEPDKPKRGEGQQLCHTEPDKPKRGPVTLSHKEPDKPKRGSATLSHTEPDKPKRGPNLINPREGQQLCHTEPDKPKRGPVTLSHKEPDKPKRGSATLSHTEPDKPKRGPNLINPREGQQLCHTEPDKPKRGPVTLSHKEPDKPKRGSATLSHTEPDKPKRGPVTLNKPKRGSATLSHTEPDKPKRGPATLSHTEPDKPKRGPATLSHTEPDKPKRGPNQINPREGRQLSVIHNQINPREGQQLCHTEPDKPERGPATLSHTEPDKPKRGPATLSHTEPDKPKRGSATLSHTEPDKPKRGPVTLSHKEPDKPKRGSATLSHTEPDKPKRGPNLINPREGQQLCHTEPDKPKRGPVTLSHKEPDKPKRGSATLSHTEPDKPKRGPINPREGQQLCHTEPDKPERGPATLSHTEPDKPKRGPATLSHTEPDKPKRGPVTLKPDKPKRGPVTLSHKEPDKPKRGSATLSHTEPDKPKRGPVTLSHTEPDKPKRWSATLGHTEPDKPKRGPNLINPREGQQLCHTEPDKPKRGPVTLSHKEPDKPKRGSATLNHTEPDKPKRGPVTLNKPKRGSATLSHTEPDKPKRGPATLSHTEPDKPKRGPATLSHTEPDKPKRGPNQINPREGRQLSVIHNQINPREGQQLCHTEPDKPERGPATLSHTEPDKPKRGSATLSHTEPDKPKRGPINPREGQQLCHTEPDKPERGPATLSHTEPDKPKRGPATLSHTEPDKPKRGSATLSHTEPDKPKRGPVTLSHKEPDKPKRGSATLSHTEPDKPKRGPNLINPREGQQLCHTEPDKPKRGPVTLSHKEPDKPKRGSATLSHTEPDKPKRGPINPREGQQLCHTEPDKPERGPATLSHTEPDKPKRGPATLSHTEPDKPKRGPVTLSHTEPDKPKRGSATLSHTEPDKPERGPATLSHTEPDKPKRGSATLKRASNSVIQNQINQREGQQLSVIQNQINPREGQQLSVIQNLINPREGQQLCHTEPDKPKRGPVTLSHTEPDKPKRGPNQINPREGRQLSVIHNQINPREGQQLCHTEPDKPERGPATLSHTEPDKPKRGPATLSHTEPDKPKRGPATLSSVEGRS